MRVSGRAALSIAAVMALSGCVVEGKLDASGGARLQIRYRLVSVAHFEQSKARFQSADVRLANASMAPDKRATFVLETADVHKLSTAPAFAGVTVALADAGDGARTLSVAVAPTAAELPLPYVKYLGNELRLAIEVPGDVLRSNATAVSGRTASWVLPLAGKRESEAVFSVTCR
jgi:hypothetical protein